MQIERSATSTALHTEVRKLQEWLKENRWVDQYDAWWRDDGVVGSLRQFLALVPPQTWSEDEVTDLLYILEQSSTDYVAELFGDSEAQVLAIARHSLARGGIASDDIAEQLGRCVQRPAEAEALLLAFAQDGHERTRRIALLSLAALQSMAVPALAMAAWDTGDEFQRMGALSALKTIGSDLYPVYLLRAKEDGREHLMSLASQYDEEVPSKLTD